ncbi:transcriptional-regulating factor 1-like [Triticum dicoccoides]|uniref:transcriptional-regulating factor 1-like n=1 Tax=Triticum dicoccoides TaxID=85692 RepID=UPI001891B3C7|nr:transcriptional-regulating factor 1-like [Triticum dicoccoides]
MAAAKIVVLLAATTALFAAAAGAADPQPPQLASEAQCWPCYSSCMQTCDAHGSTPAPDVVNSTDGSAVAVHSTVGAPAAIHKTEDGSGAPVADGYDDKGGSKGGGGDDYEKYFECKKKCIVDCYKDLPPVCYKMCVSQTCLTLPPCKRGDCFKACGSKCFHNQPYPGPNPGPTPPKPMPPPPSPPKPMPPRPSPIPPKPSPPNAAAKANGY